MTLLVVGLVLAAALLAAGPGATDRLKTAIGGALSAAPPIERRHVAAAALLAAAAVAWSSSRPAPQPTPAPGPAPDSKIVLRGKFVGPDAAADAAATSALLDELAAEIEWDAMQTEPLIRTGQAVYELRARARELRCRGVSLGEKHPRARDAIKEFLDQAAGESGGPLTPEQRSAWVAAYREIARAAADAAR
jgi:hypothetical protein